MTHLDYGGRITKCSLLQTRLSSTETADAWHRLGLADMPEGDVVTADRAAVDCKRCIDSMIATDDHSRWNMQFFSPDGSRAVKDGEFIEPEIDHDATSREILNRSTT